MERRSLVLLFLAILMVSAFLYLRADRVVDAAENRAVNETFRSVATESGTTGATRLATNSLLPPVQNQTTNAVAMRRDLAREVQQIEAKLSAQRQALQQQESALDQLQTESEALIAEQAQNQNASTQNLQQNLQNPEVAVQERTDALEELTATLEEMRAARESIRREEEEAIVIRENANQLEIARIDAQLQRAEEEQATTRSRLEQWAQDKAPVNGLAPPNQELETLFAQQQQQIDSLREQRLALTTDLHVQADTIYNLSQQARADLRAEEQNVRSQIFSLQNEIRRVQRSQVQNRRSEQSRAARLQEAQRRVQMARQQVRSLETTLQNKRTELRRLE